MPSTVTVFRDTVALAPGLNVIPHGLYSPYIGAAWKISRRMIVHVVDTAPDNGQNASMVGGWDETQFGIFNDGALPQTVDIEAVLFFPHLGLDDDYPDVQNIQTTNPPAIAPATHATVSSLMRDKGAAVPPTFELHQIVANIQTGRFASVVGAYSASREIHLPPAAPGPQTYRVQLATYHSIQRAIPGLSARDTLISTSAPITLDGGEFVEIPHGLREAGINVLPDIASALIVGGAAEGVVLTAPAQLYRTAIDDTIVRWENHGAPGDALTIYGNHLYLHSSGRI